MLAAARQDEVTTAPEAVQEPTSGVLVWGKASMQILSNGVRLIVEPVAANEVVAVVCLFPTGASTELPEENGLTNLTMRMLTRGTRTMSAAELNEKIESMGASLSAGATEDCSFVSLNCVRDDLGRMLAILDEVIFEPALKQEELDKEREVIIAALKRVEDNRFQYTYEEFLKDLYRGHPYGVNPRGTPESLPVFEPLHLEDRHLDVCRPEGAVVSVVGAVDPRALAKRFEKWSSPPQPARQRFHATKTFRRRGGIRTVEKAGDQAFLVIGSVTVPMSNKDAIPLRVASAALGEGMSSRLFVILRERASLGYVVGSMSVPRFDLGHFACYIGVSSENVDRAQTGIELQVKQLAEESLAPEELERAKNYTIGRFRLSQQTNDARARLRAVCEMAGLGYDYGQRYPDLIRKVKAADVRFVANKYLTNPVTVIVTPRDEAKAARSRQ